MISVMGYGTQGQGHVCTANRQPTPITRSWGLECLCEEWHEVFPNAACVVSLIDRLVHRCEIVAIEGESYRLKEAKARAEQKAATRAGAPRKGKKT
jgi:IstB-like ATP binding protein